MKSTHRKNLKNKNSSNLNISTDSVLNKLDSLRSNIKDKNNISKTKPNIKKFMVGGTLVLVLVVVTGLALFNNNPTNVGTIHEPVDAKILDGLTATIYKSPTCGCCHKWIEYMSQNTQVSFKTVDESGYKIKQDNNIPKDLYSCHTVFIGNYVIEGHVPYQAIVKLFQNQPNVIGISVAGMPSGSPGMGEDGSPFTVNSFDINGNIGNFMEF